MASHEFWYMYGFTWLHVKSDWVVSWINTILYISCETKYFELVSNSLWLHEYEVEICHGIKNRIGNLFECMNIFNFKEQIYFWIQNQFEFFKKSNRICGKGLWKFNWNQFRPEPMLGSPKILGSKVLEESRTDTLLNKGSSSSSSCRAISTDIPDRLSPPLTIVHCFRQVLRKLLPVGPHLVSAQSCCMKVRAGRPAFARPCEGVHNW